MSHGGKRPGAGRRPGSRNTKTVERESAVDEAMRTVAGVLGLDEPFEGDAVALLQLLYRNPVTPLGLRFDAAKAAAPFERPKLAAVEQVPAGSLVKHEDALAELEREPGDVAG